MPIDEKKNEILHNVQLIKKQGRKQEKQQKYRKQQNGSLKYETFHIND